MAYLQLSSDHMRKMIARYTAEKLHLLYGLDGWRQGDLDPTINERKSHQCWACINFL